MYKINFKNCRIWDSRMIQKSPIRILKAHNKWISDVKFNPNMDTLFLTVKEIRKKLHLELL